MLLCVARSHLLFCSSSHTFHLLGDLIGILGAGAAISLEAFINEFLKPYSISKEEHLKACFDESSVDDSMASTVCLASPQEEEEEA